MTVLLVLGAVFIMGCIIYKASRDAEKQQRPKCGYVLCPDGDRIFLYDDWSFTGDDGIRRHVAKPSAWKEANREGVYGVSAQIKPIYQATDDHSHNGDNVEAYLQVLFEDGAKCRVAVYKPYLRDIDTNFKMTVMSPEERREADEQLRRRQLIRSMKHTAPSSTSPSTPMCPSCHGFNTGKITAIKRALEHSTFGWAAPSSGNTFECYDCGYKW